MLAFVQGIIGVMRERCGWMCLDNHQRSIMSLAISFFHRKSKKAMILKTTYKTHVFHLSRAVVLQGSGGAEFRGFIMQARRVSDNQRVGTWSNVAAGTQGLQCNSDTVASQNSRLGTCATNQPCGVSMQ